MYVLEWLSPADDKLQRMESEDFCRQMEQQMWDLPDGTWVRVTQETRLVIHEGRKIDWKRG